MHAAKPHFLQKAGCERAAFHFCGRYHKAEAALASVHEAPVLTHDSTYGSRLRVLVRAVGDLDRKIAYVDSIRTNDEIGNVLGAILKDNLSLVCILYPTRLTIAVAR